MWTTSTSTLHFCSCLNAAKRATVRGRLEDGGSELTMKQEDGSLVSGQDCSNFAVFITSAKRDIRDFLCVAFIEIHPLAIASVIIKMHVYIQLTFSISVIQHGN